MRISVQTMGVFQLQVPLFRNRRTLDVPDGLTVREVLVGKLHVADPDGCVVASKGRRIGSDEVLHEGDDLKVFAMLSGG